MGFLLGLVLRVVLLLRETTQLNHSLHTHTQQQQASKLSRGGEAGSFSILAMVKRFRFASDAKIHSWNFVCLDLL